MTRLFWFAEALTCILGFGPIAMARFCHWPPELMLTMFIPMILFSIIVYIRDKQGKHWSGWGKQNNVESHKP